MMNHANKLNAIIAATNKDNKTSRFNSLSPEIAQSVSHTPNTFFTSSVLGMEAISHVIEEQALKTNKPFRFYSAFQKFSRFKPQEERYRKLVATRNPIYVFGLLDAELWKAPNLYKIPLDAKHYEDEASLIDNWFVVLHNPEFVSMGLIARELPNPERPTHARDKLIYRNFEGFWTYDKEVINSVVEILDDYIEQRSESPVRRHIF